MSWWRYDSPNYSPLLVWCAIVGACLLIWAGIVALALAWLG